MMSQAPKDKLCAAPAALPRPSRAEAEEAIRTLLLWAGDDPTREGLADTPARVARAGKASPGRGRVVSSAAGE